ncbi:MAG: hypothetical protein NTV86_19840 [Planctomycetota bacterium]|nr:hypothetical protein [Planctomycetota bacterium]
MLLVNVAVHLLSYFPAVRLTLSMTWPLFLGIFPVFLMFIVDTYTLPKSPPQYPEETKSAYLNRTGLESGAGLLCLFTCMPRWILCGLIAIFLYLFLQAPIMMGTEPVAHHTEEKDGHYFVVNGGRRTEVTREVRNLADARNVRFFSSPGIFFSLIPSIYFRYTRPVLLALGQRPGIPPAPPPGATSCGVADCASGDFRGKPGEECAPTDDGS